MLVVLKEFAKELQEDEAFLNEEDEQTEPTTAKPTKTENKNCTPPQWAIDMGHKEMWKKHHGCSK